MTEEEAEQHGVGHIKKMSHEDLEEEYLERRRKEEEAEEWTLLRKIPLQLSPQKNINSKEHTLTTNIKPDKATY